MRLILAAMLLSACGSGPPRCEAQLHRFDDAPDAGRGEARHAFALDGTAELTATPDGVACVNCGTLFHFDDALAEQRETGVDLDGTGAVAAAGDTSIVLDRDYAPVSDIYDDAYRPPHFQLFAVTASGDERWRKDFADGKDWTGNLPSDTLDGPFTITPRVVSGPSIAVVYGVPLASVFEVSSGRLVFTTPAAEHDAITADANAGLFVVGRGIQSWEASLRHMESDGVTTWTKTWSPTATTSAFSEISFRGAAPAANGGLVVAGDFNSADLDLGGTVLPGPGAADQNPAAFVAGLDDQGATQWAVSLGKPDAGYIDVQQIAATADGAVICGEYAGAHQLDLPNTGTFFSWFIARVDASGAVAGYRLTGVNLTCRGLATAADGSTTVLIESAGGFGDPTLHVGTQSFANGPATTSYVLNMTL